MVVIVDPEGAGKPWRLSLRTAQDNRAKAVPFSRLNPDYVMFNATAARFSRHYLADSLTAHYAMNIG
jgi:hypothetical protein